MIASLLDNDLYKFTMQQAVLEEYAGAVVEYRFTNRRPADRFGDAFARRLRDEVRRMADLRLTAGEGQWLAARCPFFTPQYLGYLASYRFDPDQVRIELRDGQLELRVAGPWHATILWEVPLLAIVSETYFLTEDTQWDSAGQAERAAEKARRLATAGCHWADFGTRRRRDRATQESVVDVLREHAPHFVGTSNVHLARQFDVKPIGTMAHEWIMGVSALEGLRHANRHALRAWHKVYQGQLGIALTDTYGTDAFFGDFDSVLARQFDGVRHDSGDPRVFTERVIAHYQSLRVPASTKTIVFSDGLDVDEAVQLQALCAPPDQATPRVSASFGIGTHLTNDFPGSRALNIVIKLWSVNGVPVVKLSDVAGKAQGDADAVRVARWTFDREPL